MTGLFGGVIKAGPPAMARSSLTSKGSHEQRHTTMRAQLDPDELRMPIYQCQGGLILQTFRSL